MWAHCLMVSAPGLLGPVYQTYVSTGCHGWGMQWKRPVYFMMARSKGWGGRDQGSTISLLRGCPVSLLSAFVSVFDCYYKLVTKDFNVNMVDIGIIRCFFSPCSFSVSVCPYFFCFPSFLALGIEPRISHILSNAQPFSCIPNTFTVDTGALVTLLWLSLSSVWSQAGLELAIFLLSSHELLYHTLWPPNPATFYFLSNHQFVKMLFIYVLYYQNIYDWTLC